MSKKRMGEASEAAKQIAKDYEETTQKKLEEMEKVRKDIRYRPDPNDPSPHGSISYRGRIIAGGTRFNKRTRNNKKINKTRRRNKKRTRGLRR